MLFRSANCPESLRDDIRLLFQRIIGEFVYEGNEEPYYLFRHLYTKRLFKVRQASVEMKGIGPGELVFTSIVCWRGEWWVSGTLASYGNAEIAQQKAKHKFDPGSISFYAYTPEQQQNLREMAMDMENAYLEFFGERMVFFKNNRELQAALEKQNEYYNQTKTKADKKSRSKPSNLDEFRQALDTSIDDLGKGLAIFFEPGEGTAISSLLPLPCIWSSFL